MKASQKVLVTVGVLLVLVALFYGITLAITTYTGHVVKSDGLDEFAKCLNLKGVRMYGAYWCGHCQNQKAMFGGEKILTDNDIYIECDPKGTNSQTDLCLSKGIEGYPTWEIGGKLYPGELKLDKLAEMSGCSLN